MSTEIIAHTYNPYPVYQLFVYARPTRSGKGRDVYTTAVKNEALKHFFQPIRTFDIEVSVFYSSKRPLDMRADIDNILKPTLDALCNIAYNDDQQVRSVSARLIDRTNPQILMFQDGLGHALINPLFHAGGETVLIHIYSESTLRSLGQRSVETRIKAEALAETDRVYQANKSKSI